MKHIRLLPIAAAGLVALASCSSGTIPYLVSVVPSSVSVQMPKSLVQSGTTAKALSRDMVAGGGMMGTFTFDGQGTSGYHWIKQGIWDTQKRLARAAWNMLLVDSIVSGQKLSPSSTAVPGQTVTWTQAMVDAYTAMIPSSFASDADFENAAKLPTAGQTSQVPDFVYDLVPSTDAANYPTYYYQVTFTSTGDGEGDGETEAKTLYWSQDKTKFKFAQSQSQTDTTTTPATVTVTEQNFVAYDASTSTMAAGRLDENGTMQVQLKSDPASTANGVFITFDASIKGGDGDSEYAKSGSVVISAQGYADRSGGTVTETITISDASTGAVTLLYLKESFDPSGHLTSAATSADGTTWTSVYAASGVTSIPTSYDGKVGEVQHQDFSGAGDEVNSEFKEHHGDMASSGVPTVLEISVATPASLTVGAWVASNDATFKTAIIGAGYAKEAGELKIAFTAPPASGASFFIAPIVDASTTPPTLGTAITATLK
ncbi:MAG TPA: hypothetical protein VMV83_02005 [Rectinemataceae bacterium]|nr:hypothetical protein [Rectinemataceae bacterium]